MTKSSESVPQESGTADTGSGKSQGMKQPRACGFLIVTGDPVDSFLLMKHRDRWDLPKGHVDAGETDLRCALRELEEETGITEAQLEVDQEFLFEHRYRVNGKRYRMGDQPVEKTLLIFLGRVAKRIEPALTEHPGFQWFDWSPPHCIQEQTIDPLLAALERHLQ